MVNHELEYPDARDIIADRQNGLIEQFNRYLLSEFGPTDVREHFLLDGSPVIQRADLTSLPEDLQAFFRDGRISVPPESHVYSSGTGVEFSATVKDTGAMVALRGFRFYGADGKYPWGPNGEEALDLLRDNIRADMDILGTLSGMKSETVGAWLATLAAWDYVRNDLSAAYYLRSSMAAKDPVPAADESDLHVIDAALAAVSKNYIDTLLHMPGTPVPVPAMDSVYGIVGDALPFVSGNPEDDVIRLHRELGNPQAVLFAFHLMYGTDKIREADLVIAPLYGAIDIAHALRYVMTYGDGAYERITGTKPSYPSVRRDVEFIHHKIIPRGKPRSELNGVTVIHPKRASMLDNIPERVFRRLQQSGHILFVDDSAGTFGSKNEIIAWMNDHLDRNKHFDWVVAHGGIRWAHAQNASLDAIVATEAIASTPLSKKFKDPLYAGGRSGYMPDAVIADMILRTERTALDLPDAGNILRKLHGYGILRGAGYDLYETLVKRDVPRHRRRNDLNAMASEILGAYGVSVTPDEYYRITRPVWSSDIAFMAKSHQEIDLYETMERMVAEVFSQKGKTPEPMLVRDVAWLIANGEFTYEMNHTIPNDGMEDLLEGVSRLGIPQGIYSNTPYPRHVMDAIIRRTGIDRWIPMERILFSSVTRIVKPGKETMFALADSMEIPVEQMSFMDNAATGVEAAMRARAIPVRLLFADESKRLRNRIAGWRSSTDNI